MESKVTIIMQEMLPLLNNEQLLALRESLEHHLVDGKKQQKYSNNNLLQLFITAKQVEGCSSKTIRYYQRTIENLFNAIKESVTQLTTDDLRSYLANYQSEKDCSKANLDNIRRILSSFFAWLEQEEYIIKNPIRRIKKIKTEQNVKETYTDEHLEIMRDNCENLRDLAIIDLLASTGMRVGELVQLNRSDIDFENRECVVFGKGKKERPVYFDARTKIHLRNYLNDRKDSHPALFVTLVGKAQRLGIAGVEIRLRKLGDKLGIQKVHPHKFRRTLATKAIDKGMPIEQVQKLLGHSKIDTTLAYAMVNQNNVKHSHQVEAGDILISWSGTLGVFQWRGRSAVLNQHIFKVVLDKIDIDKSYFKYVVEKGLQDAVKHTHGSTMKHLTKKYFDNIIVPYTNLGEQQRIASELDLLSKLILRRQEQLEELNLLVKSRFNEMFGENKIFESIDNLFDIIDGDRGKNYPKSDELFSEEYCLFLNTKNVTKNGFSFDTKQFITKTKDKLLRKGKLERYDIVLTTRGTVGNVAYYDELIKYKHLRINSGMVILRPKTPNLNQKFIIHVLRNNNYSRVISGSAQPQLPITKLKKILLPLPPLALQNEFADFVALVDKSQFACEIAIKVWRNSLKFSII